MESDAIVVDCAACDRSFRVKPVLAGKRFACKCGAMIQVPAAGAGPRSRETDNVGVVLGGQSKPPPSDDAARRAARRAYAPEGVSTASMKRLSKATVIVFFSLLAIGALGVAYDLFGDELNSRLGDNAKWGMLGPAIVLELAYLSGVFLGVTIFSSTSANRHALAALICRVVGIVLLLTAIFTTDGHVALDRASPAQVMYLLGLTLVVISPLAWLSFHQQIARHLQEVDLQKKTDQAVMFAFFALLSILVSMIIGLIPAFGRPAVQLLMAIFYVLVAIVILMWGMVVLETRAMAKNWIQTLGEA